MKLRHKVLLIIFILLKLLGTIIAQTVKPPSENLDKVKLHTDILSEKDKDIPNYETQISELNKQITSLTMTVASTKESFYNSNIYLWTFIITALGLVIVFVGIFGYKSISDKIVELKEVNEKSASNSGEALRDMKVDLLQRISEIKSDFKDFKAEQTKGYEKFEKDSKERIEKGLGTSLQNAIEKIMKESFIQDLTDLSEQVATLTTRLDNNLSKQEFPIREIPLSKENNIDVELSTTQVNKPNNNAFDE